MADQKNIMKEFRISKRESVRDNIQRILYEQVDYMLEHCENEQEDVHKSIHEIRKSIKRIRAVLRLIRDEIGYSTYYRENVFYRDINRNTSELRTYNVLAQTLEKFSKDLSKKIPPEDMEPLIRAISDKRESLLAEILSDNNLLKDLGTDFREARERIPGLPIEHNGFEVFHGGVLRMYRQGRDYLSAARNNPDTHHLHDMRKRMKYLWFHVEILKPIYPGTLRAFANSLENITEKLGIYHDLAVLEEYLGSDDVGLEGPIRQTLLDACGFKKAGLLPGIMRMSEAAYIEDPEAFMHRISEYWKIFYRQT